MLTEARQTDRCNIWTICFYKHITFCVSLSLSLTAGLCFTWPDLPLMGSIAAKWQTHTLTHANTLFLYLFIFILLPYSVFLSDQVPDICCIQITGDVSGCVLEPEILCRNLYSNVFVWLWVWVFKTRHHMLYSFICSLFCYIFNCQCVIASHIHVIYLSLWNQLFLYPLLKK